MTIDEMRTEVHRLHLDLPRHGLVAWTSGNVSARDPETGLVVIKPSGIRYEDLTPASMCVVDLEGRRIEGALVPSSDTRAHLFIYRARTDVNGIVHTHSSFATAFAAVGRPIPAVLTAICDEFGGPIPCLPYAAVGGDEIGRTVVGGSGASPAVLIQNHGVFAFGPTAEAAVKTAVMVEDAARTVYHALTLGEPIPIPPEEIARAHERYVREYGQRQTGGGLP
jgi:L-ribulose-5-phosphate 4-epimerase